MLYSSEWALAVSKLEVASHISVTAAWWLRGAAVGLEMQFEGQSAYPAFPGTRGRISSTKDTSKTSVMAVMDSHWAMS